MNKGDERLPTLPFREEGAVMLLTSVKLATSIVSSSEEESVGGVLPLPSDDPVAEALLARELGF